VIYIIRTSKSVSNCLKMRSCDFELCICNGRHERKSVKRQDDMCGWLVSIRLLRCAHSEPGRGRLRRRHGVEKTGVGGRDDMCGWLVSIRLLRCAHSEPGRVDREKEKKGSRLISNSYSVRQGGARQKFMPNFRLR